MLQTSCVELFAVTVVLFELALHGPAQFCDAVVWIAELTCACKKSLKLVEISTLTTLL